MLRFFRINDPYRLIVIFLVLLIMRLPMFISGEHLSLPELNYLLVGEKFNEGSRLYSDIWTKLGPLSAIFYGVMNFLFGRSLVALQILALLVIFFQSFILNKILLMSKAFDESTYLPGIVYALLMSWFFDQFSLSPALLGLTFLLLALNNLLVHLESRAKGDELIHMIGVHIGVATLFYLPYAIFVPFVLLTFALFSNTIVRRYLLVVYGFILPIALCTVIFMVTGRLGEFLLQYIVPSFGGPSDSYLHWVDQLIIFAVPILFFLLGLFAVVQRGRFTVFQANLSQFMIIWVVFDVAYIFLVGNAVPANLIIFVPPVTYYICQYFLTIRRRWLAEIIFAFFVIAPVFFNHGVLFGFSPVVNLVNLDNYLVQSADYDERVSDKRILVLGSDLRPYANAKAATPFLEWSLATQVFESPQYYDNLTLIGNGISNDIPDVIIDQEGIMRELRQYIPGLNVYRSRDGVFYQRAN